MNKKKFFDLVFFISGTFIVLAVTIVVTVNFFKDGRLFAKPVIAVTKPVEQARTVTQNVVVQPDIKETYVYTRKPDVIARNKTDFGEAGPPPQEPKKEEVPVQEKIKVEVINYTDRKNLAEQVRAALETGGFEVSAGNATASKPVRTEIIDRNDKAKAAEVKKVVKVGTIRKEPDPNSRFDVTLIIGEDYIP